MQISLTMAGIFSRFSIKIIYINPLSGNVPPHEDVPYVSIILLCLVPDDFTCHGESAATQ
jgi:hypothetical protein